MGHPGTGPRPSGCVGPYGSPIASSRPGEHREGVDQRLAFDSELPRLYRAALDAVDELARRGERVEASRLRAKAIRAYGRAWDEACRRTLEEVCRRAAVVVEAGPRPRVLTGQSTPGLG